MMLEEPLLAYHLFFIIDLSSLRQFPPLSLHLSTASLCIPLICAVSLWVPAFHSSPSCHTAHLTCTSTCCQVIPWQQVLVTLVARCSHCTGRRPDLTSLLQPSPISHDTTHSVSLHINTFRMPRFHKKREDKY